MKKPTTTQHCTPSQLKALLSIALEESEPVRQSGGWMAGITGRLIELGDVDQIRGDRLLSRVLSPDVSIRELQRIKEASKVLHERASTDAHREAALVLYHTTLAVALAQHGEMLSRRRVKEQQDAYRELGRLSGDPTIDSIMRKAVERLETRTATGK